MKTIYTTLFFLLFHQLLSSQQLNINMKGIIFDIYEGNYLDFSYYNHTTKKNYVEASDYISVKTSFVLEAPAGDYPGYIKIYLSNDTTLDAGDVLLQSYRHNGKGISSGVSHIGDAEAQMTCQNFPNPGSRYVIYKHLFDNYSDNQVGHSTYYKSLYFSNGTESLLYYASPNINGTKQINQGDRLYLVLQITNNSSSTQKLRSYSFYLCKTNTFDLPSAIKIKDQTIIFLPTGDAEPYGNLSCDSIQSKKTKTIFNYPLDIPVNVPSGDYYVYAVQDGNEKDYKCLIHYGSEKITIGQTVGINSTVTNDQPFAYPNPASTTLTVNFGKPLATAQVEITNILGEKINTYTIERSDKMDIDMQELKNGVYFITIISAHQKNSLKVLKTDNQWK